MRTRAGWPMALDRRASSWSADVPSTGRGSASQDGSVQHRMRLALMLGGRDRGSTWALVCAASYHNARRRSSAFPLKAVLLAKEQAAVIKSCVHVGHGAGDRAIRASAL